MLVSTPAPSTTAGVVLTGVEGTGSVGTVTPSIS
jgi:hypothetical protein